MSPIPFATCKTVVRVRPFQGSEATTRPEHSLVPRPIVDFTTPSPFTLPSENSSPAGNQSTQSNRSTSQLQDASTSLPTISILDALAKFKPKRGWSFNFDEVVWGVQEDLELSNTVASPASPARRISYTQSNTIHTELFEAVGEDMLACATDVRNSCVFIFGAPGSGSVQALFGENPDSPDHCGLLPRYAAQVFARMNDLETSQAQALHLEPPKLTIDVTALEATGDVLSDLLLPRLAKSRPELKVREDAGEVYIQGITKKTCNNEEELVTTVRGAIKAYLRKPNSHFMCTLTLTETLKFASPVDHVTTVTKTRKSFAQFVLFSGFPLNIQRLFEVACSRDDEAVVIPFRESMFTRLLTEAVGGNCNTIAVACISPYFEHIREIGHTLQTVSRMRRIRCHSVVNEDEEISQFRRLGQEIEVLANESNLVHETTRAVAAELDRRKSVLDEARRAAQDHKAALDEASEVLSREVIATDVFDRRLQRSMEKSSKTEAAMIGEIKLLDGEIDALDVEIQGLNEDIAKLLDEQAGDDVEYETVHNNVAALEMELAANEDARRRAAELQARRSELEVEVNAASEQNELLAQRIERAKKQPAACCVVA